MLPLQIDSPLLFYLSWNHLFDRPPSNTRTEAASDLKLSGYEGTERSDLQIIDRGSAAGAHDL